MPASNARRARIKAADVALAVGASASAVSRAFTPGASVAPELKRRILDAARDLGYRPNAMARAVAARQSGVAGVLMAVDTNLQYPEALSEIARAVARQGLRTMLFTLDRMDELPAALDQIWSYQVDGLIALVGLADAQVRALEEHGVPVVLLNRAPGRHKVSSVACDHRECGELLAARVLAGGHRRVGLIEGPPASTVAAERIAGARALLEAGGAAITAAVGDFSHASGRRAALALLAAAPTAIIAASDMMAIGAIDAVRLDAGSRVPEDVAVLGIDGIGAGRFGAYALTTVRQPIALMAEAAAEMLARRVKQAMPPEARIVSGTLVVGATG